MATNEEQRRIDELEDQLKQRDRRIIELKEEIDGQRELIERFREHAEDYDNAIESWCDTFGMELTDDGWTWKPFWDEHVALARKYDDLVRDWNRVVSEINAARFGKRGPGRPLLASNAQIEIVRKLRKRGMSLRDIVIETNLTLGTVRTIVSQITGTDRTTQKHRERVGLERIKPDKTEAARWKRKHRTGNALPKRAQAVIETGNALVTEAKGLGRAR
jgi:hypothetical protein